MTPQRVAAVVTLVAMSGAGAAAAPKRPFKHTVTICMDTAPAVRLAQDTTERMFAGIAVGLTWRPADARCPPGAIIVSLSFNTPTKERPDAFGYALPFEGTRIRVFYDRVMGTGPQSEATILLAHVLAHEIAHVAQAIDRHSTQGVMKARWTRADLVRMTWGPLPFTPHDVDLIHAGLASRAQRAELR